MYSLDLTFAIRSFVALFIIVGPFSLVPIFLSLTERFDEKDRKSMINTAVLVAAVSLVAVTVTGNIIFQLLAINMYSFRIAGGIILLIISIEMLFGRRSRTVSSPGEMAEERDDLAITPMAIPLLTGPGAITTGIVLFESAQDILLQAVVIANILLVFLISHIILSRSEVIHKVMGHTGTKSATRIMGLMLSAISVQFIIDGIMEASDVLGFL